VSPSPELLLTEQGIRQIYQQSCCDQAGHDKLHIVTSVTLPANFDLLSRLIDTAYNDKTSKWRSKEEGLQRKVRVKNKKAPP